MSHYRRERHNPVRGGLDTVTPILPVPADIGRRRDTIEIDRLRKAAAEDIERALLSLTEDARTVILLDLEGLSEAETAEVIGCAVGTVKSRLSRARAALRETLRDWAP